MSYEVYYGTLTSITEYANKKCAKIVAIDKGYKGCFDALLELPSYEPISEVKHITEAKKATEELEKLR